MERALEFVLGIAIVAAALAFGGVQPIAYFPVIAVLYFALLLLLLRQSRQDKISLPLPLWPALFALFVVLQVVPLPSQIVSRLYPDRLSSLSLIGLPHNGQAWTSLSFYPHSTVVALLKFLAYLSAFLLAAYFFDSRKGKSTLLRILILLGCFEAGYGILQYLTGWHKIFAYTKEYDLNDATGTYINRNNFAGLLELILPFALAMAFYSFQKRSEFRRGGNSWRSSPGRGGVSFQAVYYLFLLALMGVALVFSRSKGGILAAIFSLIFIALLGQIRIQKKGWMVLVVLFLTVIMGYGLWIGLNPVLARFEQLGNADFLQTEGRIRIWKSTLHLVRDHPVAGTGLGTYGIAFRHYQTNFVKKYVDHAHNDYLEFASETGLPGLALLFLPIFYLLIRMVVSFLDDSHRYRRSILLGCIGSTVALLIHSVTDFNLQIPANALVFAVVLGIGYKATCLERREPSQQGSG